MEEISNVKEILREGVRVFMSLESNTLSDVMQSSVAAVSGDDMAFTIPIKDGFYHPLSVGTRIEAYFFLGGGRYYFKTVISKRIKYNDTPVLVSPLPKILIRTERRQFYRIETRLPVKISLAIEDENAVDSNTIKVYSAQSVDISGGGLQLDPAHTKEIPLKLNDIVEIDFEDSLLGPAKAESTVVREPRGSSTGWGFKFTKMSDSDRDKVIRFVFKKQLDEKKRKDAIANT